MAIPCPIAEMHTDNPVHFQYSQHHLEICWIVPPRDYFEHGRANYLCPSRTGARRESGYRRSGGHWSRHWRIDSAEPDAGAGHSAPSSRRLTPVFVVDGS